MELFQKIVAGAVTDARADARILRRLSAGTDHPMLAAFPEGEYLKGLLLEKVA
ncbi:Ribosomal RNA large subunit methyltransferase I [compost metagenome]|jgi:23S rRNA (cytosine1962-C5)-methyltransferase